VVAGLNILFRRGSVVRFLAFSNSRGQVALYLKVSSTSSQTACLFIRKTRLARAGDESPITLCRINRDRAQS
jgi:hypothetical protein